MYYKNNKEHVKIYRRKNMKNSKHMSKDDYILRSFAKIQHKKWELYVITRIIHSLNDPDIEFVCQQLIKTKNNKRSLTDLCFPELKLYCEIDEERHKKNIEKLFLKNYNVNVTLLISLVKHSSILLRESIKLRLHYKFSKKASLYFFVSFWRGFATEFLF